MQRLSLIITMILLSGALAWMLLIWHPQAGTPADDELLNSPQGGDFTLQSDQGPVSLNAFRGKVVLLYFGYTWCPDICPTNLAMISTLLVELSDKERAGVQAIFISVDPARDSVERLKSYVAYFNPKLLGLTGSEAEIAEVAQRYGAAYKIHKEAGQTDYVVDHTADTYLIDMDGHLVKSFPHGTSVEELLASVRELL